MDWFLYDNGLRHERVKSKLSGSTEISLFFHFPFLWTRFSFFFPSNTFVHFFFVFVIILSAINISPQKKNYIYKNILTHKLFELLRWKFLSKFSQRFDAMKIIFTLILFFRFIIIQSMHQVWKTALKEEAILKTSRLYFLKWHKKQQIHIVSTIYKALVGKSLINKSLRQKDCIARPENKLPKNFSDFTQG